MSGWHGTGEAGLSHSLAFGEVGRKCRRNILQVQKVSLSRTKYDKIPVLVDNKTGKCESWTFGGWRQRTLANELSAHSSEAASHTKDKNSKQD